VLRNAASQCCFAATLCSAALQLRSLVMHSVAGWACTLRLAISTSAWPSVKHWEPWSTWQREERKGCALPPIDQISQWQPGLSAGYIHFYSNEISILHSCWRPTCARTPWGKTWFLIILMVLNTCECEIEPNHRSGKFQCRGPELKSLVVDGKYFWARPHFKVML
jgi:hypothetical protein